MTDQDNVVNLDQKKLSKIQMKKLQAYEERRKRLINKGVKPEDVDSYIAKEDYDALPVERKLERLNKIVSGLFQSFQNQFIEIAQQTSNINYNQNQLADAMDINNRAFQKLLFKLGITEENFQLALTESRAEIEQEIKEREEAEERAEKEKQELSEKQAIVDGVQAPTSDTYIPPEATIFGE